MYSKFALTIFLRLYCTQQLLKSGKGVLTQVANALARRKKFVVPDWERKGIPEPCEEVIQKVKKNGNNLALPPLWLKYFEETKYMKKAICEGFLLTNRYEHVFKFSNTVWGEHMGGMFCSGNYAAVKKE